MSNAIRHDARECDIIRHMKNHMANTAVAAALVCVIVGCEPSDGAKEFDQGLKAYEMHDLKKAEKLFTECVALAPSNADALIYLARVKLDAGDIPAARSWVDKATESAGGDVDVKLLSSQVAWHEKDYAKASEGFSSVANDANLSPELRAQGWTGLGIVEMAKERHHLARIAFLRAIRLDRRAAAAWYHLGLVYRDAFGYYEAALEQFEIFVRLEASASPRVQKVLRAIIPALKEQISREAANRPGVSKRDSASSAASLAKAEAAWKKGNFRNARDAYQAALSADPLSYPAALGLAKAWAKTDTSKAGQGKSFENYKLACTLRPGAISTFLTTGDLAARLGYHAQAAEIFSRAVAASPASIQALDGLIRALQRSGGHKTDAQAYQLYRESIPLKRK